MDATHMPLNSILREELEADWTTKLRRFDDLPLASSLVANVEEPLALVAIRAALNVVGEPGPRLELHAALCALVLKEQQFANNFTQVQEENNRLS